MGLRTHSAVRATGRILPRAFSAPRRGFSPAFAPLIPREDRHAAIGAAVSWPRRASALAVTHRRECGWSPTCCNDAGTAVALALWVDSYYGSGWFISQLAFGRTRTGDDEINPRGRRLPPRARGFISSSHVSFASKAGLSGEEKKRKRVKKKKKDLD